MTIGGERVHVVENEKHSFILEHLQRYRFAIQFIKGKIVLDLGCGEGYGSKILKDAGAKQVVGVDINKGTIRLAKKNYSSAGISFQVDDAQSLGFGDKSFDVVISLELIEHLQDYWQYLEEVRRLLKSGGVFILSTPNKDNYRGQTSPFHTKEFNLKDLREILTVLFQQVEIYGQQIINPQIVKTERDFFRHYQWLTFRKPLIKKLFLLIPPKIKAFLYRKLFTQAPAAQERDFKISKGNLEKALTFLAICHS